ncbi:MAG: hypothetical protein HY866_18025 [Chloroflexi bacterium]|nr:hypothetical protein [Chloroflexota bacterium]
MNRRWFVVGLWLACLSVVLLACSSPQTTNRSSLDPSQPAPPTPAADILWASGASPVGARLQVTLPSIKLLKFDPAFEPETSAQLFVVLADGRGNYSYLVTPANRAGSTSTQVDLTNHPVEISIEDDTETVTLWVLAVYNVHYRATEMFGLEALAASLSASLDRWLDSGNPRDDPLAAIVSASEGALFDWFASIEVLGQDTITFSADTHWNSGLNSQRSADGGLNVVYSTQYLSAQEAALLPTIIPTLEHPGYELTVDETFANGTSTVQWYEGTDNTYTNAIVNGAYEIRLKENAQRDFGLSWGSIENRRFKHYIIEATVRLVEDDVQDGRYGIWFNYQDDYNFMYFGLSNTGEYRIAAIVRNSNRVEIQDWTQHRAVRQGAAVNILTIEAHPDGEFTLFINGERVRSFTNETFDGGSIAFFCYAESVPTTCRLERLRLWEPVE